MYQSVPQCTQVSSVLTCAHLVADITLYQLYPPGTSPQRRPTRLVQLCSGGLNKCSHSHAVASAKHTCTHCTVHCAHSGSRSWKLIWQLNSDSDCQGSLQVATNLQLNWVNVVINGIADELQYHHLPPSPLPLWQLTLMLSLWQSVNQLPLSSLKGAGETCPQTKNRWSWRPTAAVTLRCCCCCCCSCCCCCLWCCQWYLQVFGDA